MSKPINPLAIGGFTVGALALLVAGLLMSAKVWLAYFAALPLVLAALYLGGRVHVGLTHVQMMRLVGGLVLVSALLFKFRYQWSTTACDWTPRIVSICLSNKR